MCLSKDKLQGSDAETADTKWLNHCVHRFIIKNCAIYLCTEDVGLESEWFTLQTGKTRWQIRVSCEAGNLSICLVRDENDDGPETVVVNYKLSIKNEDNTKLLCQQCASLKKAEVVSLFPDASNTDAKDLLHSEFINLDHLEIIFEVFALETDTEKIISKELSSELQELSRNFLSMYESGDYCDIILTAKDGELMAHKAILAKRSSYFAFIDVKETSAKLVDFSKNVIDKILRYMYSGRFVFLPSDLADIFEIQDAVNVLKPSNLDQAFGAKEINFCMEAQTDNFEFPWNIENYAGQVKNDCEIKCDRVGPKGKWTFMLCPNSEKPESMKFSVNVFHLGDKVTAMIQAFIGEKAPRLNLDSMGKNFLIKDVQSGHDFEFPEFVPKTLDEDFKESHGLEDNLKINVILKCGIPEKTPRSSVTRKFSPSGALGLPVEDLNKLSEDFLKLLNEDHHSDVELKLQDVVIKVHKAIIKARWSSLFFAMNLKGPENKVFAMAYTYSSAMMKALTYVYSGKLDLNLQKIVAIGEVCYLAQAYKYPELRQLCYAAFKSIVDISNVHLLLLWAQAAYAEELEAFAYIYIRKNSEKIFLSDIWKDCKEIYPKMTEKVESWIKNGGFP